MKLSIVIPIYNEKDTLEEIFRLVQATPYDKEIIAVDDASTDGSQLSWPGWSTTMTMSGPFTTSATRGKAPPCAPVSPR